MSKKCQVEINLVVSKDKEGLYFEHPFEVPEGVDRLDIKYSYERHRIRTLYLPDIEPSPLRDTPFTEPSPLRIQPDAEDTPFTEPSPVRKSEIKNREEINIIDLALSSNTGEFIGGSGSDRDHIWVSEYDSSDGYAPAEIHAGTWNIIVGAYKVHEAGVNVKYEVTFTFKERRLLKGDCHMHTTGSDGILTVEEAAQLAMANKLDFLFITDHNNYSHNMNLKSSESLTLIPGVEWTHFRGHANMLGVKRPFSGKYFANSIEEVQNILDEAKQKGAIVSINHPFDVSCSWKWGLENVYYNCIEIWNGIIKYSDMQCISWWHGELCKGRRLPIIGGSDFHRFQNFSTPGMPATCVYSMSRGQSDILEAIRQGHSFVAFQPGAPVVDINLRAITACDAAGEVKQNTADICLKNIASSDMPDNVRQHAAYMGDEVPYSPDLVVSFEFSSLAKGDIIRIYSASGIEKEMTAQHSGAVSFEIKAENKRFYRTEVYRQLLPNLPPMLCLITNPIYFC